ncbi:hypothetical protein ACFPRL_21970 [Pseudoclavibacter helvolus]
MRAPASTLASASAVKSRFSVSAAASDAVKLRHSRASRRQCFFRSVVAMPSSHDFTSPLAVSKRLRCSKATRKVSDMTSSATSALVLRAA